MTKFDTETKPLPRWPDRICYICDAVSLEGKMPMLMVEVGDRLAWQCQEHELRKVRK